jgi:hypothetical protein
MSSPSSSDPELLSTLRQALDATYDIEREIGGGMSRVFVATERALGRRVVIKVLPPELTAGVNRERFRREIQFAARLQHPHIVPLLTAGQVGDILYYTMPLVEGETLRARLDREKRLSSAAVVAILQDVVDALAYAHGRGLIHRDIKPENILLQRNHALVTDFGVAKAISEALPGTAATTIGIAVGTPAYMAPEQLAADPAADHRIDLYAVGLLGYELLSGASPFSGSSPQQTLARQMTERPTPPHLRRSEVPPDLSDLIMRCLEKDPEKRWRSSEELLEALGRLRLTGRMPGARWLGFAGMPRARRNLIVGSTFILLLAAGLSTYAMLGAHRVPSPPAPPPVPPSVDTGPAPVASPVLTRADSEAIAAAFARRILAQRASASDSAKKPAATAPVPAPVPGMATAPAAPSGPSGPSVMVLPQVPGLDRARIDSAWMRAERLIGDSVLRSLAAIRNLRSHPGTGRSVTIPPEWTPTTREGGPTRLLVLDVVDVSRERDLDTVASLVTDSLVHALRRIEHTQVLTGERLTHLEQQVGGSDQVLGMTLGARAVLRSSIGLRRDSLTLFIALFDTREQRYVGSFRTVAPRSAPELLTAKVVPLIQEWITRPRTATSP